MGKGKKKVKKPKAAPAPAAEPSPMEEAPAQPSQPPAVWRAGQDPIEEGETLDYDPTAYDCLHVLTLEYPCLSFGVVRDDLGGPRSAFPHSLYFTAATQADEPRANFIAFVRVNNLRQAGHGKKAVEDEDDEEMSDSDDEEHSPPVLHVRTLSLNAGANRLRSMPQKPGVVAVWEDSGHVKVFDGTPQLEDLSRTTSEAPTRSKTPRPQPLQSHKHADEGFALDWSPLTPARLATGDNRANLHVWEPSSSGASWTVSGLYKGHTGSVEDIQWSPTEATVLATCSSDRTIRVWDTRTRAHAQLTVQAHASDVNVISWNAETSYMLASGGDEGALKVWDLRGSFAQGSPVADFSHHKSPITSVEWCPQESSMLATSAADGQLCVWDLALERDPEEEMHLGDADNAEVPDDLPPQLLFVHGGQTDLKEVHWHPQIPGMLLSTAADGFNIFKPHNVG